MTSTSIPSRRSVTIKRSRIIQQLRYSSDGQGELEQSFKLSKTTDSESSWSNLALSCDEASELVEDADGQEQALSVDEDLAEFAAWLELECEKELADVDWKPEFKHLHRHDEIPTDGLNTAVLERIRRGDGPRPSKFEDLLAPLRLTSPGKAPQFHERPILETCESMDTTLREWNTHVSENLVDDAKARESLMRAMTARINFLDQALIKRCSADAHDITCRRLLNAIHVYRPEAVKFKSQDPMDLLIIIIASSGYAIPDIDDELKYHMLYILVKERGYSAHIANADARRKYKGDIERAKRRGDHAEAAKCEQRLGAWVSAGLRQNRDVIIEKIKKAQYDIRLRGVENLQGLCVLQNTQKLVLSDRIREGKFPSELIVPRSVWWPERVAAFDAAGDKLREILGEMIDDLEYSCKVITRAIDGMAHINKTRVYTRAVKFAGLDVKGVTDSERQRIVEARKAIPGTIPMMTDAIKSIAEVKANAEGTAESAGQMETKMEQLFKAATDVHFEYDILSKLVNSDPHMELEE